MKVKVLMLLNNLEGGGAERVFVNLANQFFLEGVETAVLVAKRTGIYFEILLKDIPVYVLDSSSLREHKVHLKTFFQTHFFTHVFTADDIFLAAMVHTRQRSGLTIRHIHTHHYSSPAFRSLYQLKEDLLLRLIHRRYASKADKIVAVSKGSLAWLRKSSGNRLGDALYIYNPVFDDQIYDKSRESFHFPVEVKGKKVLLSIGRLNTQKDHVTLIKAFFELIKSVPNSVLFILGEGEEKIRLLKLIKKYQLEEYVHLVGFQQNPFNWIYHCDVFVLSSVNEGLPTVLIEAIALGKTCVSTDCPSGPAEILEEGRLGYLARVKDPMDLAGKIKMGLESPIDPDILKAASKQYHNNFVIKKYLSLISG